MKAILQFLEREALWPLVVLVLGALIILPGLGENGFWEPQEIRIADLASARAGLTDKSANDSSAGPSKERVDKPLTAADVAPPLTTWVAGQGMKRMRNRLLGSRLPLALLGLVGLLATFFLGKRLASPRAGLLSGLILLSFPLFLFQSRQLMSDIGAVTGSALTVLGLVGLAWPVGRRTEPNGSEHPLWMYAVDAALVVLGGFVSYLASAALIGLVVPFGAVAIACAGALIGSLHTENDPPTAVAAGGAHRIWPAIGLALIAATAVATAIMSQVLDRPAVLLPYALVPAFTGIALITVGLIPRAGRPLLSPESRRRGWHIAAVGLGALVVAGIALAAVLSHIFDIKDPIPGERALFGHSLATDSRPFAIIGGQWMQHDISKATFDIQFEHIAFGLFPWIVIAPIALAHIAMGIRRGRFTFSGYVLFAWATLAWIVAAIIERKIGPIVYPALVPIAVVSGIWIDDLLDARDQADATTESEHDARAYFGVPLRVPLVALFVLLCAATLAVNIASFPDRFMSVHLPGDNTIAFPKSAATTLLNIKLSAWLAFFGVLFGLALATGLFLWNRHKHSQGNPLVFALYRYGIHASFAIGLVFALFLTQVWTPALSAELSSKEIFAIFHRLRAPGDQLGLMGSYGSAPDHYVPGEYEKLAGQADLLKFLARSNRVFALVPSANHCALHRTITENTSYVIVGRNAKHLLLSNDLKPGERDLNPLAEVMRPVQPEHMTTPLSVDFDHHIELVGMDMPESVARGETFTMTLYFKVLKPISGSWKVFVHFDGGGTRFQGDHDPIGGLCSTQFWQPGDYIVDRFTVKAGDVLSPRTAYGVYLGFFQGSFGSWKNMDITRASGPAGKLTIGSDKRVLVGHIRLDADQGGCHCELTPGTRTATPSWLPALLLGFAGLVTLRRRKRARAKHTAG